MPAETHSHREQVTAAAVLELLATAMNDEEGLHPDTPVEALGLDGDLQLLAFWDIATEEYSERGLGEPDFEQLAECRTAIELAEVAARYLADDRRAPADEPLEE